eukprot:10926649-Alexandrium_andersonii.AAC.1
MEGVPRRKGIIISRSSRHVMLDPQVSQLDGSRRLNRSRRTTRRFRTGTRTGCTRYIGNRVISQWPESVCFARRAVIIRSENNWAVLLSL